MFQQALFDSARICVGHEHFIWHNFCFIVVFWQMMFASICYSARSFVGQGNIVWPILLVVWGFSASDVCRCSHLCWARKCSMTRFPCLFVWVFWQMMFASARICAGQENIIWHVFIVLSSVGFSLRFWLLWISTLGCGSECHTCSCCLRWLWGKSGSGLDCLDLYLWHLVSKWRRRVGGKASSGGNLLCWKT